MKYYLTYGLILLGIIILYQIWYRWFFNRLYHTLYTKLDAKKYLKSLDSLEAKILLTSKKRLVLKIDGYALANDALALADLFKDLENRKLPAALQINLYQKEVAFYIETLQNELANTALQNFKKAADKIKNPKINNIYHQSELLVAVYYQHDLEIVPELQKQIKDNADSQMVALLNNYRLAYIYYQNQDLKNCEKYLKAAKKASTNDLVKKHLKNCLTDFKIITTKQI